MSVAKASPERCSGDGQLQAGPGCADSCAKTEVPSRSDPARRAQGTGPKVGCAWRSCLTQRYRPPRRIRMAASEEEPPPIRAAAESQTRDETPPGYHRGTFRQAGLGGGRASGDVAAGAGRRGGHQAERAGLEGGAGSAAGTNRSRPSPSAGAAGRGSAQALATMVTGRASGRGGRAAALGAGAAGRGGVIWARRTSRLLGLQRSC